MYNKKNKAGRAKRNATDKDHVKVKGLVLALILLIHCGPGAAGVPGQYIAKMYTEVLGRAPDPGAWNAAVNYFRVNGCDPQTLGNWGAFHFSSAEFRRLEYDNAEAALLLYRAILNREPDPRGYSHYLGLLDNGTSLDRLVSMFFRSSEFSALVPHICNAGSYSFGTRNGDLAIRIPTSGTGGYDNLTEGQLQALLDSAAAGTAVYLSRHSVVYLTKPLTIPAGVTLATYGLPTPRQHAKMARLVRAGAFAAPMVQINLDGNPNPSGVLKNIWVDGQRGRSSTYVHGAINIEIYGGNAAAVDANFSANSLGWSNVHSYGAVDGRACASNAVTNNLITAYPSLHFGGNYTDGLSIGCENSLVEGNQIVDATDVGIVVFTASPAVQRSLVVGNTVVSAGNSGFGALAFDPLYSPAYPVNPDFSGAAFSNNFVWSSPGTHFVIGLAVGSRPWYGTHALINGVASSGSTGYGASATDNTTAGVRTNFGEAITVSGMDSATVRGNAFTARRIPQSWTRCPVGEVVASVSAGLASGSLQAYSDTEVNGCMSDFQPAAPCEFQRHPCPDRSHAPAVQPLSFPVGPQQSAPPPLIPDIPRECVEPPLLQGNGGLIPEVAPDLAAVFKQSISTPLPLSVPDTDITPGSHEIAAFAVRTDIQHRASAFARKGERHLGCEQPDTVVIGPGGPFPIPVGRLDRDAL